MAVAGPAADAEAHAHGKPPLRSSDLRSRPSSLAGRVAVLSALVVTAVAAARIAAAAPELPAPGPFVRGADDGTVADVPPESSSGVQWHRAELVLWFGWITAACTGLGVVPFLFASRLPPALSAASNAVACGMMVAASVGLVLEGAGAEQPDAPLPPPGAAARPQEQGAQYPCAWGVARTAVGVVLGLVFVRVTEALMHSHGGHEACSAGGGSGHRATSESGPQPGESHTSGAGGADCQGGDNAAEGPAEARIVDRSRTGQGHTAGTGGVTGDGYGDAAASGEEVVVEEDETAVDSDDEERVAGLLETSRALGKADFRRALLFFTVMAAHSLAEGVGLGVSFGGTKGVRVGSVISSTLAVHNIPEGLAICLVLVPRGTSLVDAAALSILSSLPQPLFALPAYFFVDTFAALLPVGLGFAAGAMLLLSLQELWPQAAASLGKTTAFAVALTAFAAMSLFQHMVHDDDQ
ncbi:hypothetical protein FNF27_05849 [Cafeteria roenbergensis]|uniref:ZIP family transporter n=1 Tax=Cafeteria roenbergensis TaxID=33653 RepID=A0A5A8E4A9_CAFRO|nr:hypothetical protein FNF27_05849 [Cafeteria roenbergensis]